MSFKHTPARDDTLRTRASESNPVNQHRTPQAHRMPPGPHLGHKLRLCPLVRYITKPVRHSSFSTATSPPEVSSRRYITRTTGSATACAALPVPVAGVYYAATVRRTQRLGLGLGHPSARQRADARRSLGHWQGQQQVRRRKVPDELRPGQVQTRTRRLTRLTRPQLPWARLLSQLEVLRPACPWTSLACLQLQTQAQAQQHCASEPRQAG